MDTSTAKRYVVVGTVGTGVLTSVALLRKGKTPTARVGMGVLAAGVVLAVVAEVQPSLAGAMALLMLTTAAFVVGGGAWEGITAATNPTPIGK